MKTAFITGITGQDGSYLTELLLNKGYKVVGLFHQDKLGTGNISHVKKKIILEQGNLTSKDELEKIIKKHKPDEIYNLAGITFVPLSWQKPELTIDVNAKGVLHLLEIIRNNFPKTKFYQASTAKIFGDPSQNPQTEKTPIDPRDPYAASKALAHQLIKSWRQKYGLFVVSGILYNHESERRGEEFLTRKITMAAARIKLGLQQKVGLGNLEAIQDWGYAPDYVEAMWLMLQQSNPEDYLISTGSLHSVKDVLTIAFGEMGLKWQDHVERDEEFFRSSPRALYGDSTLARQKLGWQPKTSFRDMITKMVRYDYNLLKNLN